MFDAILSFLRQYYLVVLVAIIGLAKMFLSSGKFEEFPGNKVLSIKSTDDWNALISDPANKGKLMIIDFYALWCPPCRMAAPIYGKMSLDYEDVMFVKVDVDAVPALMRDSNVRAMPTFQLYKDRQQLDQVVGFQENKIRRMIDKHRQENVVVAEVADATAAKNKET